MAPRRPLVLGVGSVEQLPPDDTIIGGGLDPADVGYDVILVLGQSNASGAGTPADATYLDVPDPRIHQWGSSGPYQGQPVLAQDPLFHVNTPASGQVGAAMTFAREYLRTIPVNRRVLLVPAAIGSTGFTTTTPGSWDMTGGDVNLYQNAVARCTAAVNASPRNRLVAITWQQGEADVGMSQAGYAAKLDALIAGIRANVPGAATCPFLVGQMVPTWLASSADRRAINAAHIDTARRVTRTAFAYGVSGQVQADNAVHYNAVGARAMGVALAAVLSLARANVTGTPPVTPSGVTLAQVGSSVAVAWQRTPGRVTDYLIEYAVDGGAWTALTRPQNLDVSATLTGQAAGTTVQVRVSTVNEQGVSAASPPATITLAQGQVPGQVTGLAAGTSTTTTQPLTWSPVSGATGYLVEYRTSPAGAWTSFATVTTASVTVTGLTTGTAYDYRVVAVNAVGQGPASATVTASTAPNTVYAADTFTRADAPTAGTTEVGGYTWALTSVTAAIVSNRLRLTSTAIGGYALIDDGQSDGTITATLLTTGVGAHGLAFRVTPGGVGYKVNWEPANNRYTLAQMTSLTGTTPLVSTSGITPTAGDVVSVVMAGQNLTVKLNGTAILTYGSATISGTRHGLAQYPATDVQEFDTFSHVS